jgi:hypothetical protein
VVDFASEDKVHVCANAVMHRIDPYMKCAFSRAGREVDTGSNASRASQKAERINAKKPLGELNRMALEIWNV